VLFLQIKGTDKDIKTENDAIVFDVPVQNLKYASLFSAPILLALCPVKAIEPVFYFLWLQEYIRVVLQSTHADWRLNKTSVRVRIPASNKMPGSEDLLSFMANFPRRQEDWGQVARIVHELNSAIFWTNATNMVPREDFGKGLLILRDAEGLSGLLGDPKWRWGGLVRKVLLDAMRACAIAYRGPPYTSADLSAIGTSGTFKEEAGTLHDQQLAEFLIRSTAQASVTKLSAMLATGNDYRMKYAAWQAHGDHDF
jgi:hypothetical protein